MLRKLFSFIKTGWAPTDKSVDSDDDLSRQPVETLTIDQTLWQEVQRLAREDNTSAQEAAHHLIRSAIRERQAAEKWLTVWENLPPREKETVACICIGLSNQAIGERMIITQNTVKTHVRNVFSRFGVRSKVELRELLADWDFSEWLADSSQK
ncbi:MAG: helix-turn-helix transcriptional regulator [Chloroflexota bacterium]